MKISVLLPVFNAEEFLFDSINSILNQTYEDFELLIFNDGSTDRSKDIIHGFKDKRIRYFENKGNMGIVYNLNKGIRLAKGEYLARMDADDIAFPKRFEEQVSFLDREVSVDILGSGLRILEHDRILDKELTSDFHRVQLLNGNTLAHPTVMFRKSSILKAKLKYDKSALHVEDYKLWLESSINDLRIYTISDVLLYYRSHIQQISKLKFREQIDNARVLKFLYAQHFFPQQLNGNNALLYIQFIENMTDLTSEDIRKVKRLCNSMIKTVRKTRVFKLDLFENFLLRKIEIIQNHN